MSEKINCKNLNDHQLLKRIIRVFPTCYVEIGFSWVRPVCFSALHLCLYAFVLVYVCVVKCVCVYACVHVYLCAFMYEFVVCVCLCRRVCVCVCVCA